MLEKYVYRNLERYGNCLLDKTVVETYGKKIIQNDLMKHGFKCRIKKITMRFRDRLGLHSMGEDDYIAEVIK